MTDKTCNRCGECCKVIPLFTQHMHPDYRKYLLNRGLVEDKEQGCILIPHVCQHLRVVADDAIKELVFPPHSSKNVTFACAIHNSQERPKVCGMFHGQKMVKGARFYIPPGCGYREG